jgi:hypothetical protein
MDGGLGTIASRRMTGREIETLATEPSRGNGDGTRTCDWRRMIVGWRGSTPPFLVRNGKCLLIRRRLQSTGGPRKKSATGTKHTDQGQMMGCSRHRGELGKEGSPCHYLAPSLSFSPIVLTTRLFQSLKNEHGVAVWSSGLGDRAYGRIERRRKN